MPPPRPLSPPLPIPVTPVRLSPAHMNESSPPRRPPNIPHQGSQTGALPWSPCPCERSRLSLVPQPLSPAPQLCSCIPNLQNLLEILWMQILAIGPCQELELQSQESSSLQAQRPPSHYSRPLGSSLKSDQGREHEWLCGTPKARQVWGKVIKSWDAFPKLPLLLADELVPC